MTAWLNRWFSPLITGGCFALLAWGVEAPFWAILFAWSGGVLVADLEQRWSKFQEEWQEEREMQENRWERLREWLEKNLESPD